MSLTQEEIKSVAEQTAKEKVKVLLACPTFGITPDPRRWLNTLLTAVNDLHNAGAKTGYLFPYRRQIHAADNQIINIALMNGYTHILRMDDDIWGVEKGDVLKLLAANKEFISAVMYIRGFPYAKCAVKKKPGVTKTLQEIGASGSGDYLDEACGRGIQQVDLTAMPFTLFQTSMFKKLTHPYHDAKIAGQPDSVFCQKCADAGIQIFAHMDIQVCHGEVTPWNRLYLYNAEAREALYNRRIDPTTELYRTLSEEFGPDGMKDPMMLKGKLISEVEGEK